MCFSASASFVAAAGLAGIGGVSVRLAPTRAHVTFAAIPLLFAAQQASEGALWLVLDHADHGKSDTVIGRVFLFFALFVWPVYLPTALRAIEPSPSRRMGLAALATLGAILGAYLMSCASLRKSDACIAYGNLYYWVQFDPALKRAIPFGYLGCIVGPLALSSLRGTSWLAGLAAVSFAATGWLYRAGFISIWCFEAAALSGAAALIVWLSRRAVPPP